MIESERQGESRTGREKIEILGYQKKKKEINSHMIKI